MTIILVDICSLPAAAEKYKTTQLMALYLRSNIMMCDVWHMSMSYITTWLTSLAFLWCKIMMYDFCHMSYVPCDLLHVVCHLSHVTCHMPGSLILPFCEAISWCVMSDTCQCHIPQPGRLTLPFCDAKSWCMISVTCHMSHVTYYRWYVTYHMSHVICQAHLSSDSVKQYHDVWCLTHVYHR